MRTVILSLTIAALVLVVPLTAKAQVILEKAVNAAKELVAPANLTLGNCSGVPSAWCAPACCSECLLLS